MGNVLGYSLVPIVAQPPERGPGQPPGPVFPVRLGSGGRSRTHASRIDSGASPIEMPPPASPKGRPRRLAWLVSAASVAFRWTTRGALSGSITERWPVSSCNLLSTSSRAVLASALSLNSGISRRASSAASISLLVADGQRPWAGSRPRRLVVRRHEGSGLPSLSRLACHGSPLIISMIEVKASRGNERVGGGRSEITRRQEG